MTTFLRTSTPQAEGSLKVSKWLKFQVLLDDAEMEELVSELSPFSIYQVSEVVSQETASLSSKAFLEKYSAYIETLKNGEIPKGSDYRSAFSSIFTRDDSILYAQELGSNRYLIKPLKPVIQLQVHHFFLSDLDGKYHPMVLSDESISWGIQFSYPQIYQDPKTTEFAKVDASLDFPNTELFAALTKFLRRSSIPSPFVYKGVKTHVPIRIGKKCLPWIMNHAQMQKRGIEVKYGN